MFTALKETLTSRVIIKSLYPAAASIAARHATMRGKKSMEKLRGKKLRAQCTDPIKRTFAGHLERKREEEV